METTSTMWGSSSTTSTRTRPESELTATIIERLSEDSLRRRRGDAASDPPPPAPRQTARAARFPDAIANAARPLIGGPPHARVPIAPPAPGHRSPPREEEAGRWSDADPEPPLERVGSGSGSGGLGEGDGVGGGSVEGQLQNPVGAP